MSKTFNECPNCGSPLEYHNMYQYDKVYRIKRNGQLSKRMIRKEGPYPMECGFIACSKCDFHTNCDLDVEEDHSISIFNANGTYMYESDNEPV
jgi:hypothetical protein